MNKILTIRKTNDVFASRITFSLSKASESLWEASSKRDIERVAA
jgi:hypothetical protein